jgi:hypothetical protein
VMFSLAASHALRFVLTPAALYSPDEACQQAIRRILDLLSRLLTQEHYSLILRPALVHIFSAPAPLAFHLSFVLNGESLRFLRWAERRLCVRDRHSATVQEGGLWRDLLSTVRNALISTNASVAERASNVLAEYVLVDLAWHTGGITSTSVHSSTGAPPSTTGLGGEEETLMFDILIPIFTRLGVPSTITTKHPGSVNSSPVHHTPSSSIDRLLSFLTRLTPDLPTLPLTHLVFPNVLSLAEKALVAPITMGTTTPAGGMTSAGGAGGNGKRGSTLAVATGADQDQHLCQALDLLYAILPDLSLDTLHHLIQGSALLHSIFLSMQPSSSRLVSAAAVRRTIGIVIYLGWEFHNEASATPPTKESRYDSKSKDKSPPVTLHPSRFTSFLPVVADFLRSLHTRLESPMSMGTEYTMAELQGFLHTTYVALSSVLGRAQLQAAVGTTDAQRYEALIQDHAKSRYQVDSQQVTDGLAELSRAKQHAVAGKAMRAAWTERDAERELVRRELVEHRAEMRAEQSARWAIGVQGGSDDSEHLSPPPAQSNHTSSASSSSGHIKRASSDPALDGDDDDFPSSSTAISASSGHPTSPSTAAGKHASRRTAAVQPGGLTRIDIDEGDTEGGGGIDDSVLVDAEDDEEEPKEKPSSDKEKQQQQKDKKQKKGFFSTGIFARNNTNSSNTSGPHHSGGSSSASSAAPPAAAPSSVVSSLKWSAIDFGDLLLPPSTAPGVVSKFDPLSRCVLRAHAGAITAIDCDANGSGVFLTASRSGDGQPTVKLWSLSLSSGVRPLANYSLKQSGGVRRYPRQSVLDAKLLSDAMLGGAADAYAFADGTVMHVVDVETARALSFGSLHVASGGNRSSIKSHPSDSHLAGSPPFTVHAGPHFSKHHPSQVGGINCFDSLACIRSLAVGTSLATVRLLDLRVGGGQYLPAWSLAPPNASTSTATTSVRCLASGEDASGVPTVYVGLSGGEIGILDARVGFVAHQWRAHEAAVTQVLPFEYAGLTMLATSGQDHSVCIWLIAGAAATLHQRVSNLEENARGMLVRTVREAGVESRELICTIGSRLSVGTITSPKAAKKSQARGLVFTNVRNHKPKSTFTAMAHLASYDLTLIGQEDGKIVLAQSS